MPSGAPGAAGNSGGGAPGGGGNAGGNFGGPSDGKGGVAGGAFGGGGGNSISGKQGLGIVAGAVLGGPLGAAIAAGKTGLVGKGDPSAGQASPGDQGGDGFSRFANAGRTFDNSGSGKEVGSSGGGHSGSSGDALAAAYAYGAELEAAVLRESLALQKAIYEQTREDYRPWREKGAWALDQIQTGIQDGRFDAGEFNFVFSQDDPSYEFRFQEGIRALDNSAAARGRLNSGAHGRSLTRYGQDVASTEYQNAFRRYFDTYEANRRRKGDDFNRLGTVSQTGIAATGGTASAASAYSSTASGTLARLGASQNAGVVGAETARFSAYQDERDFAESNRRFDTSLANANEQRQQDRDREDESDKYGLYGTAIGIGLDYYLNS